jgi:phage gp46-like protein
MTETERYQGDPKLHLDREGADFRYESGQPVMDQGVHNAAIISLFTDEGWAGNVFLSPESRIGSDFNRLCKGTITLSRLADIENAAVRALRSKLFPQVSATVRNPDGDHLDVNIKIGPGGELNLNREGSLWRAQGKNLEDL